MSPVTCVSLATVLALAASVTNTQSPTPTPTTTKYASTSIGPQNYTSLTPQDIQVIVDEHNNARKVEINGELGNLTWNSILAQKAQKWSDACNFTHHPPELRRWGENLAAIINAKSTSDHLNAMIKQWVEEKKHNSRGTFEECCSLLSSMCCHYTQVVWARTTSVGCGYSVCPSLTYGTGSLTNIAFLACYYNPSGNVPKITYDWRPYVPKAPGQLTTTEKPQSG